MTADTCAEIVAGNGRGRLLLFTVLVCSGVQVFGQPPPVPPCGAEAFPPYADLGQAPAVKVWDETDGDREWRPAACTGWSVNGYSTLTTVCARFRYAAGTNGLLRRLGAISATSGIRYWSTTHNEWRTLIESAFALDGSSPRRRRADFRPDEIKDGRLVYFEQTDNLSGAAIYQMHVIEASVNRVMFEVENASLMRRFYVTLFHPGDVQSIYFLDRESDDVWRYYRLIRVGRKASRLSRGHPASSINRAVALYRSLAGIPTDQEPPAAR